MGIIQGATEFLPISSSGHLVLFQRFTTGFQREDLFLDIMLHIGTLIAVAIYTRREVGMLIRGTFGLLRKVRTEEQRQERRLLIAVAVAGIPTAILGFFFKATAVDYFDNLFLLGGTFAITTALLAWSARLGNGKEREVRPLSAFAIGAAQGFAVLPGVSRSGSTIIIGEAMGLERNAAARFAFLLSIPAILGAAAFSFLDVSNLPKFNAPLLFSLFCGMIAAAIVGYVSLVLLALIVRKARLHYFAFYTGVVSIFCIVLALLG